MSNARDIADAGHQLAAWVNFNGTLDENSGSLTAGENVLIRASYNVSSCQYNGTGDYTVNFATPMPDANYSVSGSVSYETATWGNVFTLSGNNYSTSAVSFVSQDNDGSNAGYVKKDALIACVQVFR